MINLNTWPYDQPEEEQELFHDALIRCAPRQHAQVLGMFLLGDLLTDILISPPVWRERWWQFWRPVKP